MKILTLSIVIGILLIGIGVAYITSNLSVAIDGKLYDGEVGKSETSLTGYSYTITDRVVNGTTIESLCVKVKDRNAGCKVLAKEEKVDVAIKEIVEKYLINKNKVVANTITTKGDITLTKDLGGMKE